MSTAKAYTVNFSKKGSAMNFLSIDDLSIGTLVVAETPRGLELGRISSGGKEYIPSVDNALTFIIKIADEDDIRVNIKNIEDANLAQPEIQKQCDDLGLKMRIVSVEYTLDRVKLSINYLAEERVDFRELLKVLASLYHCRIDLRQIGARDKAKMIGGVGICGLPLCCSTFLNEFDGISITMAKNQMLALNIPKLSGQCGKLICCLKYEDSTYTLEKMEMPKVGQRVKYNDLVYRIASINILTKMVRLEAPGSIENVSLAAVGKLEVVAPFKKEGE